MDNRKPLQTTGLERLHALGFREAHDVHLGKYVELSLDGLDTQQAQSASLWTILNAVAAVALAMGGVGILNIMTYSVTERTREIGIRMAIGARPRDIMLQFLVEALSLSIIGGLLGLGLGVLGAKIGESFGWPTTIRVEVAAIAMGFSALVGVLFGLYPARKASQLDPIDALRFE